MLVNNKQLSKVLEKMCVCVFLCVWECVGMADSFLNSAPDGGEWWYSRFGRFTTGKLAPINTGWAAEAVLTPWRRQLWYAYFLIPCLLSVCLSLCLHFFCASSVLCSIYHFRQYFQCVCFVFLSHSFVLHFLLLSLLPHFLPKFISTPFPVLPRQSRLLVLHIMTRAVWNNWALALSLGISFRLETHTKSIPECDRYCSMTPTL